MNEFDDDIGLPEPDTRSSNKKEEGKGSFGNTEQGWDEVKTTDSFSIGSDISSQRDRIVVLGRTRSGKTVFLSRLYSESWDGKSGLRMACQSGPDHLNLMTQFAEMEKGVWPAATQGARHYTIDLTKDNYTIPMVILDYPGEVFQNAFIHEIDDENTQELLGHIDRAIAVLIIVDPGGAMHDDSTIEKVHDDYGISKAISRVRESPGGEDIPISIVLTKCDIHAKKILAVMDKKGMAGKSKWRKFLMEYYNSWFFSLGSKRKYKVFPVAAVRTRKDARGKRIPDLSKPYYNLLEPIIWSFDIVRKYREKDQKAQEMREKAEKFAYFQKVEDQKSKKEKKSLLLFWIIVILLLGGIAWGTFAIFGTKNGSIERDENKNNQPVVLLNDTFDEDSDDEDIRSSRPVMGYPIGNIVLITERLGKLTLSTNGLPGSITVEDGYFIAGKLIRKWTTPGVSGKLGVKGVRNDEGAKVVQIDISRNSAASIFDLLPAVGGDAEIKLIDDEHNIYWPIGYYLDAGGKMDLTLTPRTPIRTIGELPPLPTSGAIKMTLIFQVTQGRTVRELKLGDITVGTCNKYITFNTET